MSKEEVVLNYHNLTIRQLYNLVHSPTMRVTIDQDALKRVKSSHKFMQKELNDKIIYGINTGFGPMASHVIGHDHLLELQKNLVRSHAAGMGRPIPDAYVLASMVVRLNTLVKGYSGVSLALINRLRDFINRRIIPVVPEHGAVGTSGDLVQLAHIALSIIGEGKVRYEGAVYPTDEVQKKFGMRRYTLQPKEGLALINGTSVMTGIAGLLSVDAHRLISLATRCGALAFELVHGYTDAISEQLHLMRPHKGQLDVARALRTLLEDSLLTQDRTQLQRTVSVQKTHEIENEVQQVYSIRCIPQILGPTLETHRRAREQIEIEMNSVTDNPVVDRLEERFLHGGNFHGDYIASAVDQQKMMLVKLSLLSERRINYFLNQKVNKSFPPFLNMQSPGLSLALQGMQFVATSLAARNQSLAFPHFVHSIPTNADNQDVVSMGTDAALILRKVIEQTYKILAMELVTLAQAVDCSKNHKKLSSESAMLYETVRRLVPTVTDDRPLSDDLEALTTMLIKDNRFDISWT